MFQIFAVGLPGLDKCLVGKRVRQVAKGPQRLESGITLHTAHTARPVAKQMVLTTRSD